MATIRTTSALTPKERERLSAQRLACSYLIKACEDALFTLGLNSSDIRNPRAPDQDQRAVSILLDVLSSWRSTLDLLKRVEREQAWPDVHAIEGWLQVERTSRAVSNAPRPSFVGRA